MLNTEQRLRVENSTKYFYKGLGGYKASFFSVRIFCSVFSEERMIVL